MFMKDLFHVPAGCQPSKSSDGTLRDVLIEPSSPVKNTEQSLCPRCGATVVMKERRLNGDSVCAEGCCFPSREAVVPPLDVRLKSKEP